MSIFNEVASREIDLSTLNGTDNKGPTVAIFVGTGGDDVVVELMNNAEGVSTTFAAPPAGTILPIAVRKWVSGPSNSVGLA